MRLLTIQSTGPFAWIYEARARAHKFVVGKRYRITKYSGSEYLINSPDHRVGAEFTCAKLSDWLIPDACCTCEKGITRINTECEEIT